MKLLTYSIYILTLIFLISCNPLDKSILEDLSVKELKKEQIKEEKRKKEWRNMNNYYV